MYVVLKIFIPDKLSRDQKKLFEELAKTDLKNDSSFKKIKDYLKQSFFLIKKAKKLDFTIVLWYSLNVSKI